MTIKSIFSNLIQMLETTLLYVATPGYYMMWTCYILPDIASFFKLKIASVALLFGFQTFLFINMIGNMIMNIISEPRVKFKIDGEEELLSPESRNDPHLEQNRQYPLVKSRHLKRKHLITFEQNIEEDRNIGYYVLYITYAILNIFSGTFWTVVYLIAKPEVVKLRHKSYPPSFFVTISLLMTILITPIAYYHLKHVLGNRNSKDGKGGFKKNMKSIFGSKWYVAILWPFVYNRVTEA